VSFPRYPSYKDSGVEWLGKVPQHWEVKPLKAVTTHNDEVLDETTAPDTEIAYVDISSVDGVNGINAKETMPFSAAPSRARRRVKHGDVIVSTVRTYLRAIARIREPEDNLVVSTGFAVVRPRDVLVPDFLGNILSASYFVEQVIARSTGVSYPAINASELVAIPVTVPPKDEQAEIAEFLDRETGKIDELVAEQRRLMELLQEKRQAVISHAVTRGLNPAAPLKPSGIEWLGDVPTHWEVISIKWLSPVKRGASPRPIDDPKYFDDEGEFAWVRIADVSACDGVLNETTQRLSELGSSLSVKIAPGELFVSIAGTVGKPCISAIKACIHDGFVYFPTLKVNPLFLYRIFEGGVCYGGLGKWGTQLNLNTDTIGSIRVALPPAAELDEILAFLDAELAKLDALTAEAQRAIDLLQERRTALISAAVTGQIDVRPLAAMKAA
jgi:type I restriction enzyme S subunit